MANLKAILSANIPIIRPLEFLGLCILIYFYVYYFRNLITSGANGYSIIAITIILVTALAIITSIVQLFSFLPSVSKSEYFLKSRKCYWTSVVCGPFLAVFGISLAWSGNIVMAILSLLTIIAFSLILIVSIYLAARSFKRGTSENHNPLYE